MDATEKLFDPKKSLFNQAAWGSLCIPIVIFLITLVLGLINREIALSYEFMSDYLLSAFCLLVVGLILGVFSLFGIRKCGARLILWKVLTGILCGCGMGALLFFIAIGISMGRNC